MELFRILTDHPDRFRLALELSQGLPASPSNLEKVARQTSVEAARAAFTQWDLRDRARSKFARPDQMLFVREALEQASGQAASAYHAGLFPPDAPVTDLTTGIGGDLVALAGRGPARGFELDPERAEIARWNLAALGLKAEIETADGLAWLAAANGEWVFADPARRVGGKRTVSPERFTPDPAEIANHGRRRRLCVQKLSPFLTDAALDGLGSQIEFVSADGECKEALAICGTEAGTGRYAVHVESGERLSAGNAPERSETPQAYVYDADPAAIRAHALGVLCQRHNLAALADSNGYLTGPGPVQSNWLKSYAALYEGPGDLKTTKRKLIELHSGTPILKQRSTGLDLEKMRTALKLSGQRTLIVACYLSQNRVRHAILEPVSH